MRNICFHEVGQLGILQDNKKSYTLKVGEIGDLVLLEYDNLPTNNLYNHSIIHYTDKEKNPFQLCCDKQYLEAQRIGDNWLFLDGLPYDQYEENLGIFDKNGKKLDGFCVGSGVSDWMIDQESHIWFTYSEVGLFGNLEAPQYGIVCLNMKGELVETPLESLIEQGNIPNIIDGIALTVLKDGSVWFNYDTGDHYCLVKLRKKQLEYSVEKQIKHKHHIGWMIQINRCLLIGSEEKIFKMELEKDSAIEQLLPIDSQGQIISFEWLGGVKETIWGLSNNKLYFCQISGMNSV